MSNQGVRMEVVDILLDVSPDIDPETLDGNTSLSGDLGMGASERRKVASQIGERFDVTVTESECEQLDTVGKLVSYVETHID